MKRGKKIVGRFREELKKATLTAIVAASGIIIALSWKGVLDELLLKINTLTLLQGKLISATIITTILVLIMLLATHLLQERKIVK